MKLSDAFEEKLESAVRYDINRAYKHSDAQVDTICESVRSALFEIIVCDPFPSGT